jgi:hypothetical protein
MYPPADVLDRDDAPVVLRLSGRSSPFIVKAFADTRYAGEAPKQATSFRIEIVKKPSDQVGPVGIAAIARHVPRPQIDEHHGRRSDSTHDQTDSLGRTSEIAVNNPCRTASRLFANIIVNRTVTI